MYGRITQKLAKIMNWRRIVVLVEDFIDRKFTDDILSILQGDSTLDIEVDRYAKIVQPAMIGDVTPHAEIIYKHYLGTRSEETFVG